MSEHAETIRRIIGSFPAQITTGLSTNLPSLEQHFDHAVVCGMGGSALAGLLLKDFTRARDNHTVDVHRNYNLPPWVDANTLVIALSFSGNTAETLSAFDTAQEAGHSLIAISTGGALQKRANEAGVPWIAIPTPDDVPHLQPRHAVPGQLGILAALLAATTSVDLVKPLQEAAQAMDVAILNTPAQDAVETIGNRIPLLYTSAPLAAVGYNWKIQFNETVKRHAFHNTLPEANHNELAAVDLDPFAFLFLHDDDDPQPIQRRLNLMEHIRRDAGGTTHRIDLPGATAVERMLNGIVLGWHTAFVMAERNDIDPFAVHTIEAFKQEL